MSKKKFTVLENVIKLFNDVAKTSKSIYNVRKKIFDPEKRLQKFQANILSMLKFKNHEIDGSQYYPPLL